MLDISLQLSGFDVIIYFGDHGFDKDKAYFIQLLILMGKFHIHKMKWSGSKPNFSHFINDFKLYCKVLCNCTSKKAIRTHKYCKQVCYCMKWRPKKKVFFIYLFIFLSIIFCYCPLALFHYINVVHLFCFFFYIWCFSYCSDVRRKKSKIHGRLHHLKSRGDDYLKKVMTDVLIPRIIRVYKMLLAF